MQTARIIKRMTANTATFITSEWSADARGARQECRFYRTIAQLEFNYFLRKERWTQIKLANEFEKENTNGDIMVQWVIENLEHIEEDDKLKSIMKINMGMNSELYIKDRLSMIKKPFIVPMVPKIYVRGEDGEETEIMVRAIRIAAMEKFKIGPQEIDTSRNFYKNDLSKPTNSIRFYLSNYNWNHNELVREAWDEDMERMEIEVRYKKYYIEEVLSSKERTRRDQKRQMIMEERKREEEKDKIIVKIWDGKKWKFDTIKRSEFDANTMTLWMDKKAEKEEKRKKRAQLKIKNKRPQERMNDIDDEDWVKDILGTPIQSAKMKMNEDNKKDDDEKGESPNFKKMTGYKTSSRVKKHKGRYNKLKGNLEELWKDYESERESAYPKLGGVKSTTDDDEDLVKDQRGKPKRGKMRENENKARRDNEARLEKERKARENEKRLEMARQENEARLKRAKEKERREKLKLEEGKKEEERLKQIEKEKEKERLRAEKIKREKEKARLDKIAKEEQKRKMRELNKKRNDENREKQQNENEKNREKQRKLKKDESPGNKDKIKEKDDGNFRSPSIEILENDNNEENDNNNDDDL